MGAWAQALVEKGIHQTGQGLENYLSLCQIMQTPVPNSSFPARRARRLW